MNTHGLQLRQTKRSRRIKEHVDHLRDHVDKRLDAQDEAIAEIKALLLHPSKQAKPE